MRLVVIAFVLLAGGCVERPLQLDMDTHVETPPVDDGWAHFPTFAIQRHMQAPGLTWAQAQASCEAMSASLPTEGQWLAAGTRGAAGLNTTNGVESPVLEWTFYRPDTVSYLDGTSFYFEAPHAAPAFRCARGDQYPRQ